MMAVKLLVDDTFEVYGKLDKVKDVIARETATKSSDFEIDEIVNEGQTDLTWATSFLKQFNRVCKYEK